MSTNRPRGPAWLDEYISVDDRIAEFRLAHPTARLVTQIVERETLTFRTEIYLDGNDTGLPNAVGHADVEGGGGNRKTSPIEKVESASVGRALAFLGYGAKADMQPVAEIERAHTAAVSTHTTGHTAPPTTSKGGVPPNVTISQAMQLGAKATNATDIITTAQITLLKRAAADQGEHRPSVDADEECRRVFDCEVQQLSKTGALALINHLKAGAPDKWA